MTALRKSSPFAGAPAGFNHEVAEAVYGTIMKAASDDEARMLAAVLTGEMLSHELIVHGRIIAKARREIVEKRASELGTRLLEVAVEQARAGGDPMPALQAIETLDTISKASFGDEAFTFQGAPSIHGPNVDRMRNARDSAFARAERARRQKRDLLTGRFAVEHKHVLHGKGEKPLSREEGKVLGIPWDETRKLTNTQLVQFQRGYREVQDLLDRYDGLGPGEAALHLNYAGGKTEVIPFPTGGKLRIKSDTDTGLDPHRKLESVQLSVLPSTDLDGPGVQARFGDALGTGGYLNNDTWDVGQDGSLADELTRSTPEEQFTPGARALRRAGSLAETLHTSIDNKSHPRLSLALKVGQKAGELGPEAQKVIGPAADRAAYRYRGTERKTVDERIKNAIASLRGPGKREALIHGQFDDQGNWHEGQLLRYFRARLPRADLNTLQRKSGTIPPSEGVIIDRTGRPSVQAIGYADDHYLPFNLKNLAKLRGGEYVRTRTFGGPTTEDIYTGLIGRAKSLTVVSHNGVYTMEFDDDLRGGRRFNDKAARMVARYGQLLDAVKSEQVTTGGIHPTRLAEIEDQASQIYDPDRDPDQFAGEFERLKVAERRRPKLSARQQQEITSEFFAEQAARAHLDAGQYAHGDIQGATNRPGASGGEYARDWALRQVATMEARNRAMAASSAVAYHPLSADQREQAARRILEQAGGLEADPVVAGQKLADAMGNRKALDAFMARRADEYKKALTPLQLNSQGYELALTALQEQFPYYIKRIDFHPWTDATGDAFDTGYVAPKHNRPHAVLAGYFDKTVGQAKVHADSTRFQNFAARRGRLDEVLTPRARETARQERAAARAGAPAGSHAAAADPEVAAHLRREATLGLVSEIRRQTTFSPRVNAKELVNEPVVNWLDQMAQGGAAKNLHYLLTTDEDRLRQDAADNEGKFRGVVQSALRENETGGYFDIDPTIRRNFANEGRYERPKEIDSQNAVKHLDDPVGTEYSIPGSVFDQDAMHSPDEIDRAYHADPVAAAVRDDLGSIADGHAFDAAAKDIRSELRREYGDLVRWKARRASGAAAGRAPVEEHTLQRRAEGLLRAQQLQRRHAEAVQRIASISAPSPISPSQVEVHYHGSDAEERAASLGLPGARNRTIEE